MIDRTMVPIRFIFRSRWAALLWAGGICLSAARFAGDQHAEAVNAANATDPVATAAGALDGAD